MRRRSLLASIPVGLSTTAGCLSRGASSGADNNNEPEFEVDEGASSAFILLRNQPQDSNGIVMGDEFEIGIHLGNAGGESATGEVSVKLTPPNENGTVQTATFVVDGDDAIPSGEARFFTFGWFEATVAGDWELTAASGIEQIHQSYNKTIKVGERPNN